jgi:adenylate cyclase
VTSVRRLAAIMFTDMVGYSALVQRDEAVALKLLNRHYELLRPFFTRFHGREIKTVGDSFLVEFESALDATDCAVEIQRFLAEYNASAPPPERFRVRIGIHLGDVVHANEDVLGDAVNIAARMEPLAPPGGICVSEQVFDQIHNKFSSPLIRLAAPALKNVEFPTEVYRVVLPWETSTPAPVDSGVGLKRRVAVLPLANMSPDPADEYFADGLAEEIITELARVDGLRVIARTSVMRYKGSAKSVEEIGRELQVGVVLEGSVRKAGGRIRVTTQLIDTVSQEHLWAERFDRELSDVFEIQTDIAKNVAEALGVRLRGDSVSQRPPTVDMEAYAAYLKARVLWNQRATESVYRALEFFREATSKDPGFAQAYSGIADCYSILVDRYEVPWSEAGPKAMSAALKATELNPSLGEAHASLGLVLQQQFEWASAEREFRRAIELAPSYASGHQWFFLYLAGLGRFEEAETEIARAEEADPFSPVIVMNAGSFAAFRNRAAEAIHKWERAKELGAGLSDWIVFTKTLFLLRWGRRDEANASRREFESLMASGKVRAETDRIWMVGALDGVMDHPEGARRALEKLEPLAEGGTVLAGEMAALCAATGDSDRFFEWLERALRERSVNLFLLRCDALYSTVRADPRFAEALRHHGLPG